MIEEENSIMETPTNNGQGYFNYQIKLTPIQSDLDMKGKFEIKSSSISENREDSYKTIMFKEDNKRSQSLSGLNGNSFIPQNISNGVTLDVNKNVEENLLNLSPKQNLSPLSKYSIKVISAPNSQKELISDKQSENLENVSQDPTGKNERKLNGVISLDDLSKGLIEEDVDHDNIHLTTQGQNDFLSPENNNRLSNNANYLSLPKINIIKSGKEGEKGSGN